MSESARRMRERVRTAPTWLANYMEHREWLEAHPGMNRTDDTAGLRNESLRKPGEHAEENYDPRGPVVPSKSGMSEEQEDNNDPTVGWDDDDLEAMAARGIGRYLASRK